MYILLYFVVIWYIFPHFGMLYQQQSGNPECNITLAVNTMQRHIDGKWPSPRDRMRVREQCDQMSLWKKLPKLWPNPLFLPKWLRNFYHVKRVAKIWTTSAIFKKIPKVKFALCIGEKSPNLVTLFVKEEGKCTYETIFSQTWALQWRTKTD
jgi:hypothetical protein